MNWYDLVREAATSHIFRRDVWLPESLSLPVLWREAHAWETISKCGLMDRTQFWEKLKQVHSWSLWLTDSLCTGQQVNRSQHCATIKLKPICFFLVIVVSGDSNYREKSKQRVIVISKCWSISKKFHSFFLFPQNGNSFQSIREGDSGTFNKPLDLLASSMLC